MDAARVPRDRGLYAVRLRSAARGGGRMVVLGEGVWMDG